MRRMLVIGFAVALVVTAWAPVAAEVEADREGLKSAEGVTLGNGSVSISSHLLAAAALSESGADAGEIAAELPVVAFTGGKADVELRFDVYSEANVQAAAAAGLEVTGRYPDVGWLTGRISPAAIPALADVPGLATVHPLYGATTAVGSVENQADVSMRVDQARAVTGLDGTGIEVGVLSDSFDTNGTGTVSGTGCGQTINGTASQTSGDLPASVGMLGDLGGGAGIDEGRGMAELIHDLVPGADLSFRTAFISEADFAVGIQDLADCGADVIVDDIIYFAEPMFQDGPVAQAADNVALAGIPYFSSAGNQATYGVDDHYVAEPVSGFHDFGGGDAFAEITLGPGEGIRVVMQWNEPYDGSLGAGALSDYDIGLFDDATSASALLASSVTAQGCGLGAGVQGGDPLEIMTWVNPGPATNSVYLVVDQFCLGSGGGDHLRLATYGVTTSITALDFEAGIFTDAQQYGHAVAEHAQSVAAVFYGEIDDPSVQLPTNETNVEPFSSLGGDIPIYFDGQGDPLAGAPQTRFKPEIAAADGTNTTFFGGDIAFDPDTHPNFFGTSAAAPHAAAVAALVLDGDPSLTPAEVYDRLQMSAVDIESAGVDDLSGYGLVDALNAVATCDGVPATITGTSGDDVIIGTAAADVIVTFGGNDTVEGKGGKDLICLGPGADVAEGGGGADTIYGEGGADDLHGDAGNDTLVGGAGGDELRGDIGNDVLEGGGGADFLFGGFGDDTLLGGGAGDELRGGDGADTVKGGNGPDLIVGGSGNDLLLGQAKADDITGSGGGDVLKGGTGPDVLSGSNGPDDLYGNGGNDELSGNAGNDDLFGNGGNDDLFGNGGNDDLVGNAGNDLCAGGVGSGDTAASSCETVTGVP